MALAHPAPPPWAMLPFLLLLGAIALAPLRCPRWWARFYPVVAGGLGGITLGYYMLGLQAADRALAVGHEYFSFMVLIGALFVVSGGIHITVQGEATPRVNTIFLLVGALLANLLGTTGASMLLIRPWIRMNQYRITRHHIVFFIFVVSNVGGCLTPIGDPPLFLGYLRGVPFWWVSQHCWPAWAVGVGLLLAMFFVIDSRNYRRAPSPVRAQLAEPPDRWRIEGLSNLVFLGVILGAVFIGHPPFVREAIMLAAAAGSYFLTARHIHEANHFNFHPIREVAILFAGIFATMMPALEWLQAHAGQITTPSAAAFYWSSGTLSSVLDNAPTYLSFLSAAFGLFVDPASVAQVQELIRHPAGDLATLAASQPESIRQVIAVLQQYSAADLAGGHVRPEQIQVAFLLASPELSRYLVAISVGAVFFGANTYIGNGPNFLVKAVADHRKVHTPGFLEYIWKYTLPIMGPVLAVVWLLFFRKP